MRLGNGRAIYLPKDVYTNSKIGDEINVYTDINVYTKKNVITSKGKKKHAPFDICPKHKVFYNTCGCK